MAARILIFFLVLLVINCMMLSPPNGGLESTHSTTTPGGFIATYFCDGGYDLVEVSTQVFCRNRNSVYITTKVTSIFNKLQ